MSGLSLTSEQIDELRATTRPLEQAHTLPAWAYTSHEFYQAEVDNIFTREWLAVCRQEEIPSAGDYFCTDIVSEPIMVLRGRDLQVSAFLRTCRHRGACVAEGSGNARFFRCPFHGWTYDLKGNLIAAPHMDDTEGFERDRWPLVKLRCEIWQGVVFVNLDQDAKPLATRLGALDEKLASYHVADLRATPPMVFRNRCNWKLATEQAMDMYHVPDTHFMPRAANWVGRAFAEQDPDYVWSCLHTTSRDRVYPYVTGTNQIKTPFPAIQGLSEMQLGSFSLFLIYPSTIISVLPQGALTFFFYPEGPGQTKVVLGLYFTPEAFELPHFDDALAESQEGFIVTNNQDMTSAALTQKGMLSRFLPPGRFSAAERTTWELQRYVIQKVAAQWFPTGVS